jgi:hypothetical protein
VKLFGIGFVIVEFSWAIAPAGEAPAGGADALAVKFGLRVTSVKAASLMLAAGSIKMGRKLAPAAREAFSGRRSRRPSDTHRRTR